MKLEIFEPRTLLAADSHDQEFESSWEGHSIEHETGDVKVHIEIEYQDHHEESDVMISKPKSSLLDYTLFGTVNHILPIIGFAASETLGFAAGALIDNRPVCGCNQAALVKVAIGSILLIVVDNLIAHTVSPSSISPSLQYTAYGTSVSRTINGFATGFLITSL